jgi:hypothetical protein
MNQSAGFRRFKFLRIENSRFQGFYTVILSEIRLIWPKFDPWLHRFGRNSDNLRKFWPNFGAGLSL